MSKNKRYIDGGEECVVDQFLIDTETDEYFFIDNGLDEIIKRLNEQENRIHELEQENQGIQNKVMRLLDYVEKNESLGLITRNEIKKWWNGDDGYD